MSSRSLIVACVMPILVAVGPPVVWGKHQAGDLNSRERAACQAYLAELQAVPGEQPIVDPSTATVAQRFEPPVELPRPPYEYLDSVPPAHQSGIAVLAGVVELDGTLSHSKLVVPSGNQPVDEYASKVFRGIKFGKPGYVAGKPVRWFFTRKFSFHAS